MALQQEGPAPYTSPSAVIEVIERFRDRGLQTPFTVEVLIRAGVTEGLAPRTHQALKQLDLIDDSGEPTDALKVLQRASSEEYKERFADVIRSAYAPIFQYTDPAQDTLERVRDAFRPYTPHGQQARMVTLFMGLCEYSGVVAARPKQPPKTRRASSVGSVKPAGTVRTKVIPAPKQDPSPGPNVPEALLALIRQALPRRGGTWTTNARESFVKTFLAVLDFSVPVDDSPPPTADRIDDEGGE